MLSEGEWDDVYVEERRGDRRFKPINIREWNQIIRPQNPIIFSFYYGFMADYPMEDRLSRIDLQYTPNLFSKAFIISSCFSSHPSSCSLLLNLYSLETSFASDRSSSASSCSRKEISVWRCKRTRALVVPKRRRIAKLSAELRKAASCG
jgi:hypothetical protein